jgi:hypothetical protein
MNVEKNIRTLELSRKLSLSQIPPFNQSVSISHHHTTTMSSMDKQVAKYMVATGDNSAEAVSASADISTSKWE